MARMPLTAFRKALSTTSNLRWSERHMSRPARCLLPSSRTARLMSVLKMGPSTAIQPVLVLRNATRPGQPVHSHARQARPRAGLAVLVERAEEWVVVLCLPPDEDACWRRLIQVKNSSPQAKSRRARTCPMSSPHADQSYCSPSCWRPNQPWHPLRAHVQSALSPNTGAQDH